MRVKDVIITRRLCNIASPLKMITSLIGVDQSLPSLTSTVALSKTVINSHILGTVPPLATKSAMSPSSPNYKLDIDKTINNSDLYRLAKLPNCGKPLRILTTAVTNKFVMQHHGEKP